MVRGETVSGGESISARIIQRQNLALVRDSHQRTVHIREVGGSSPLSPIRYLSFGNYRPHVPELYTDIVICLDEAGRMALRVRFGIDHTAH